MKFHPYQQKKMVQVKRSIVKNRHKSFLFNHFNFLKKYAHFYFIINTFLFFVKHIFNNKLYFDKKYYFAHCKICQYAV